jgi:peptide deformylase
MSVLSVLQWPNPLLETKAQEVKEFDDSLREFVASLYDTMHFHRGIGLAANQVGILKRVFVIEIPHDRCDDHDCDGPLWWHNKKFTFINPIIQKKQGKTKEMEGCLSFPDIYEWVDRSDVVTVKAFDEFGKEFQVDATGLFSVCIQHELDHLDGLVFINRMSRLKASLVKKKIQKKHLMAQANNHKKELV